MPHLLAGLDGLDQRIDAGLTRRMRGQAILRGSEGRILDLIGTDGTRPSVLAEGAWISKQAMGKRIHDLEARGLVTLEPDPLDGRAVIVRRTAEGDRIRMFAGSRSPTSSVSSPTSSASTGTTCSAPCSRSWGPVGSRPSARPNVGGMGVRVQRPPPPTAIRQLLAAARIVMP